MVQGRGIENVQGSVKPGKKIKKKEALEVDYQTKFIELAGEINTLMPYYVVTKTIEALKERRKS